MPTTTNSLPAALLALALAAACGGRRAIVTKVRRAPGISLAAVNGDRTLGLRFEVRCTDLARGPEEVYTAHGSDTTAARGPRAAFADGYTRAELGLRERRRRCAGDPLEAEVVQGMRAAIRGQLLLGGFRVVDGPTGVHDLVVTLDVLRRRTVRKDRDLVDGPGQARCSRLCGSPTCEWSLVDGGIRVLARFDAPPGPDGRAQSLLRLFSGASVSQGRGRDSGYGVLTCDEADRRQHLDAVAHDWDRALADVLGRARQELRRLLAPWEEEVRIPLLPVERSPDNARGRLAGQGGRWRQARSDFRTALDELGRARPDDERSRARLLHNLAACQMLLGELVDARETTREALALHPVDEAAALAREIDLRIEDRGRL